MKLAAHVRIAVFSAAALAAAPGTAVAEDGTELKDAGLRRE